MTPEQQRFLDYATVEAAANGFAFELRKPRDDREGASLTIRGRSGYDTLGISPDGWVGLASMSQSYDRDLSKFTKKLLAAGKKMRPKPEKKPKAPRPPARRCSSGDFKDHSIIRQIVDRVHVGTPEKEVLEYARSRLAPGAWDKLPEKDRKAFECEVLKVHDRNRALYRQVTHATKRRSSTADRGDPLAVAAGVVVDRVRSSAAYQQGRKEVVRAALRAIGPSPQVERLRALGGLSKIVSRQVEGLSVPGLDENLGSPMFPLTPREELRHDVWALRGELQQALAK